MDMKTKAVAIETGLAVKVPSNIVSTMGIKDGSKFTVSIVGKKLILEVRG